MKRKTKAFIISFSILVAIILLIPFGMEQYTSQPAFCGSCHIMKPYQNSWKNSKHKDIPCVDCHYAPGEQHTLKSKFRGLSQLFTYLATSDAAVRKQTHIDNLSCTTAQCHALSKDEFTSKRISLSESVSYVHKTHFDETIEGQKVHCTICHRHQNREKHFEVSKATCNLCHFKNEDFNTGRGECSLCHKLSDAPLQSYVETSGAKTEPITHQSLEAAGVSCTSCHIDLIRGDGAINRENCGNCHEQSEELFQNADDKKTMHEKHVAEDKAKCSDCHQPIVHKEEKDFLETVRANCQKCHPDHHKYQKALLLGDTLDGISKTPGLMNPARTNCLGCHITQSTDAKGESILRGSPEACADCHTKKYEEMLYDWQTTLNEELAYAKENRNKAVEALAEVKSTKTKEEIEKLMEILARGENYLNIVENGSGIHNKKYAIMLIDEALNAFDDLLDAIKKEEKKNNNEN